MSRVTIPAQNVNGRTLGEVVADDLGISHADGYAAVLAVLDAITRSTVAGHTVNVTNFGTWSPVERTERPGRDFRTGEPIRVPATRTVQFRPAPRLRALVAAADPATATIRKHPKSY